MNTENTFSPDELEAHEVRILAVLLGEASAAETAAVETLLAAHPALLALRARLALTIGLLRDTARVRTNEKAPAQLSPERREALLAVLSKKTTASPASKTVSERSVGVSPAVSESLSARPRKPINFRQVLLHPYVGWAGLAACLFLGVAISIPEFGREPAMASATGAFDKTAELFLRDGDKSESRSGGQDYVQKSMQGSVAKPQAPAPESKPGFKKWFGSASVSDEKSTLDFDTEGFANLDGKKDTQASASRADTNLALNVSNANTYSGTTTVTGGVLTGSKTLGLTPPPPGGEGPPIASMGEPPPPSTPLPAARPASGLTAAPALQSTVIVSDSESKFRSSGVDAFDGSNAPQADGPAPNNQPLALGGKLNGRANESETSEIQKLDQLRISDRTSHSGLAAQRASGIGGLTKEKASNAPPAPPPAASAPTGEVSDVSRFQYSSNGTPADANLLKGRGESAGFGDGVGDGNGSGMGGGVNRRGPTPPAKNEEAARKPSEMTVDPFSAPAPPEERSVREIAQRGTVYSDAVVVTPGAATAPSGGEGDERLRQSDKAAPSGGAFDDRRGLGWDVGGMKSGDAKDSAYALTKAGAGQVPILGDVPVTGRLFEGKSKGNKGLEEFKKAKEGEKAGVDPFSIPAAELESSAGGGDRGIVTRQSRTKGNSSSFLDSQPELRDKLQNIKIDDVNFRGLPLSRVVETLSALSVQGDTVGAGGGRGLQINLFDPTGADPTVNITLRDLSLGKTLEFVAEQVGYRITMVDGRLGLVPGSEETHTQPAKPILPPEDISRPLATLDNAFSTFALNVSDASFRLTRDSLNQGTWDATKIRSEEFYNAFHYRDPAPQTPIGLTQETAAHPFTPGQMLVRLGVQTQAQGRAPQQSLHLTVLLDSSGSMERPDRREAALAALRGLSNNLGPQDTISLVSFSATPRLWLDHIPGEQSVLVAETAAQFPAEGGTNLEAALQAGYEQAEKKLSPGSKSAVILLTDGSANLGNADANSLADLVTANRQRGIAFHAYGVGSSDLNDATLERLARNGDGRYAVLSTPEEAQAQMVGPLAGSFRPAALDVKVQVEWNSRRVKAHRLVGFAERRLTKEQFRDNTVDGGELAAAASGNALYSVETIPDGDGPLGTVRVRYRDPATDTYRELSWPVAYDSGASAFGEAPRGLRLAGVAALLAERLQGQPAAQDTVLADLRKIADQLAGEDTGDAAVPALAEMVRQAEALLNNR